MGCTNCGGKVGCDHRKGAMISEVDRVLAQLYPTRTWGEPHDDAASTSMQPDEVAALADELASELAAGGATFVRPGDDTEPCDFIYVLCMGRTPCIVQVRDHGVPVPAEWEGGAAGPRSAERREGRIDELYLRLVISQRARVAAVQQVAISATEVAGSSGGSLAYVIRESPRAGVYDAPLLHRMQKLVAVLPAYDLLHVDFGEIAHAPPGFHAGTWPDLFGAGVATPAIANYLFYPQPTTMISTTLIGSAA